MHASLSKNPYVPLILSLALSLSGCAEDTPTGTGDWRSGLTLHPDDGAVLTADFKLIIGTDEVDSMVVYLDDTRLAVVSAPPFVWPLDLTDFEAGNHTLAVTVFAAGEEEHLSSGVLMCHGIGANVGNFAPAFSVVDLDGRYHSPDASGNAKVILLDFWATWCPPCRAALPETQHLFDEYGDQGLKVLTIDAEAKSTIEPFMAENGYDFPVLLDTDRAVNRLYNVLAIPQYIVIDHRGVVRYTQTGTGGPPLEDIVKPLLPK